MLLSWVRTLYSGRTCTCATWCKAVLLPRHMMSAGGQPVFCHSTLWCLGALHPPMGAGSEVLHLLISWVQVCTICGGAGLPFPQACAQGPHWLDDQRC